MPRLVLIVGFAIIAIAATSMLRPGSADTPTTEGTSATSVEATRPAPPAQPPSPPPAPPPATAAPAPPTQTAAPAAPATSKPHVSDRQRGALAELHLVPHGTLGLLLQELIGAHAVDATLLTVYPDFVEQASQLIPASVAARLLVFPAQSEINAIHVSMLNPTDGVTRPWLGALSGCRVLPMVAHEATIIEALGTHYRALLKEAPHYQPEQGREAVQAAYRQLMQAPFDDYVKPAVALVNRTRDRMLRDPNALAATVRDPIIVRLVQQLLARAIEAGASDVHIEPSATELRVRWRVDGAMQTLASGLLHSHSRSLPA